MKPSGMQLVRSKARGYLPDQVTGLVRRVRHAPPRPPDPPADEDLATLDDLRACYRLFLNRRPDDRGFRSFASGIATGEITVAELSKLFVASPEFRHRLSDSFAYSAGVPELVELHDGGHLYVSSTDSVVGADIKLGKYEPHVVERMRALLRPGMTFVDIGASCGFYTVLAATAVGAAGQVIAFEPGPQNRSVLLLNIAEHKLDNVRFHPVALSDETGILLYYTSGGNGAIMPFSGQAADLAGGDLVVANRLDDCLEHEARVDVVKIDVEGAEGRVVAGGRQVLSRHHPALFFEFSPPSLSVTSGRSGSEFLQELQGLGYSFEVLEPGPREGALSIDQVIERFEARDSDHLDILAQVASSPGA